MQNTPPFWMSASQPHLILPESFFHEKTEMDRCENITKASEAKKEGGQRILMTGPSRQENRLQIKH